MSDLLPTTNDEYGSKTYWDRRYSLYYTKQTLDTLILTALPDRDSSDDGYDWFKSYQDLAHIFHQIVPEKSSRILILGCGNSKLSEEMYDDGYRNIVNIDYSSVVIEKMTLRHSATRPEMKWYEMDIRQLSFEDETFDVAIDKGTMDAMMTSKGDVWDPPQDVVDNCTKEVSEVVRVLRKGKGIFLYLTFGQPHFRKRFLSIPGTTLEIRELGEAFHYYFYILRT